MCRTGNDSGAKCLRLYFGTSTTITDFHGTRIAPTRKDLLSKAVAISREELALNLRRVEDRQSRPTADGGSFRIEEHFLIEKLSFSINGHYMEGRVSEGG